MHDKDALGRYGEDLAVRHLQECGLTILSRNWRCELGELDVVARDGGCLVVCEVKTRRSTRYGDPVEAVGPRKVRRLRRLAIRWLDAHQVHVAQIRFDVIGVLQPPVGAPIVQHVKGVD